jgi:hypothetical protein
MNSPGILTQDPDNPSKDQITTFGHIVLIAVEKNSMSHEKKFVLHDAIQIAWDMWTDALKLKYNIPIENPDDILEDILSNAVFNGEDSQVVH